MTMNNWPFDLYHTDQGAVETTQIMTQAEADRRNAQLRALGEQARWVPKPVASEDDIDYLTATFRTKY